MPWKTDGWFWSISSLTSAPGSCSTSSPIFMSSNWQHQSAKWWIHKHLPVSVLSKRSKQISHVTIKCAQVFITRFGTSFIMSGQWDTYINKHIQIAYAHIYRSIRKGTKSRFKYLTTCPTFAPLFCVSPNAWELKITKYLKSIYKPFLLTGEVSGHLY